MHNNENKTDTMKKQTETIAEYKAPKCKLTVLHAQKLICTSPGAEGAAGGDGKYTEGGDY